MSDTHREVLPLTAEDQKILKNVDQAYRHGRELKDWWDEMEARDAFTDKFQLLKEFDRPLDSNFGYVEDAKIGGRRRGVMGEMQSLFYDRPKEPSNRAAEKQAAAWFNEQVREFALRYFIRITSSRETERCPQKGHPAPGMGWLSQCPGDLNLRKDIGFYQLFYKRKDGRVGRFADAEQAAFVDAREIGTRYDWILAKARLFDFQLTFFPLGRDAPPLVIIDNKEHLYALFTPYFVIDDPKPADKDLLGEYGLGFAIVPPPPSTDLFTIGPQVFTMGFNYFKFQVYKDGRVQVKIVFCCNQLDGIFPLPASPVEWGLGFAHLATGGLSSKLLKPLQGALGKLPLSKKTVDPYFSTIDALNSVTGDALERDYCISKTDVFKYILSKHGTVFDQLIGDSVRVWRQIPDWTDASALPAWVVHGEKPTPA